MYERVRASGRPSVINLSFATPRVDVLNAAVEAISSAGAIIVSAAGNDAGDACMTSPASSTASITVASSNALDMFSSYSAYGACVSIVAPGESIVSASAEQEDAYVIMSGTSMAAPHVAGVVAGILQARPTARLPEIRLLLQSSATMGSLATRYSPGTTGALLYAPPTGCGIRLPAGTGCTNDQQASPSVPSVLPTTGSGTDPTRGVLPLSSLLYPMLAVLPDLPLPPTGQGGTMMRVTYMGTSPVKGGMSAGAKSASQHVQGTFSTRTARHLIDEHQAGAADDVVIRAVVGDTVQVEGQAHTSETDGTAPASAGGRLAISPWFCFPFFAIVCVVVMVEA